MNEHRSLTFFILWLLCYSIHFISHFQRFNSVCLFLFPIVFNVQIMSYYNDLSVVCVFIMVFIFMLEKNNYHSAMIGSLFLR